MYEGPKEVFSIWIINLCKVNYDKLYMKILRRIVTDIHHFLFRSYIKNLFKLLKVFFSIEAKVTLRRKIIKKNTTSTYKIHKNINSIPNKMKKFHSLPKFFDPRLRNFFLIRLVFEKKFDYRTKWVILR